MNFTFSLILIPKTLAIRDQFYLNIFTSLGVCDYIKEKTDAIVHIKWPNDVMVNNRKICGILIENQLQGRRFANIVVGIGLNINQKDFSGYPATSLCLVTDQVYTLSDELEVLLLKLERRYLQLHQQQYERLKTDYLNAMYWLNEKHVFMSQGNEFEGMIGGIDDAGRLKIVTIHGSKYFDLKEVVFIK
jgi:BirA family biotin operon repressor/biotin-[acetyl-CoA-carboxylase] ligase